MAQTKLMKLIRSVPMAMCGLALGLAALGNLLLPLPNGHILRYICGGLSLAVLVLFALKAIFDRPHVKEELKTPVPLSMLPTATMAVMLLCAYLRPYAGLVALVIWYAAIALQLAMMLVFIRRFVFGFKLGAVFPSWFIAGVGIVTVSVTAPAMGAVWLGRIVSCMMLSLRKIDFYPTYSAFTFPYVISALAFRLGANFLAARHGLSFLVTVTDVTMWVAVGMVLFVLWHYVRYFRFWVRY